MPRPIKDGLSYFPLDADFFENNKIKILRARYGSDGVMIYMFLLCEIYKNGYYIKIDEDFEYILSSDLGMSHDKAKQVLTFLLSRSLFDNKLFQSDAVLTSAGIQKRFQNAVKERARKNRVEVGEFWILKESETEPFIKCTHDVGYSRNNSSNSRNNSSNSGNNATKKSKVKNNNIYIEKLKSETLIESFKTYLMIREKNYGVISSEQIDMLIDDLCSLTDDTNERIAIVKKSSAGGYKSFFALSNKKKEDKPMATASNPKRKTKFNNFKERDYDMADLESKLIQ